MLIFLSELYIHIECNRKTLDIVYKYVGIYPVFFQWYKHQEEKDMETICWGRQKPLPVDVKLAVCEPAQNQAQIFGMPEGTLYAHEISFV